jgi:hypothetical protein
MNIYILIKQISDLKEILPDAYYEYKIAKDTAKAKQEEIHTKGYTDFKVYVQCLEIH